MYRYRKTETGIFFRYSGTCVLIFSGKAVKKENTRNLIPVLRIRIRIHRIHMFLGLPDPDPLVRGMDPDPDPALDPDPSIIMQK
jgi:hypothetical protein